MNKSEMLEDKQKCEHHSNKKMNDNASEIDEHISSKYEIKRRIGKGAYGIVYKAVDKKTNEIVAIKKIFDAFRNQTDAQRTYREIFFLQAFRKHPNIIKLHSIHRAINNKDVYLGFEYMQTDLHNVIKCGNILKDVHKRYIMYQMLKATKYIHSGNVIHRDQKPSNVLIDNACRVKIADFGLARSVSMNGDKDGLGGADPCLTDYVATRWYRAPEILIASKSYTKGVDMWSLGCILGEMVVGKPLFPGSSTVNQLERIMSSIPTPSEADIVAVCTGYGSSLVRQTVKKRISLKDLLKDGPDEAIDLISCLLIFNPAHRRSATQALTHPYVSKFNQDHNDPILTEDVIPPLREDLRLSIDEYRNRIYGLVKRNNARKIDNGRDSVSNINGPRSTPVRGTCPTSHSTNSSSLNKADNPKTNKTTPSQRTAPPVKMYQSDKQSSNSNKTETLAKIYNPNVYISNRTQKVFNASNELALIREKRRNQLFKNKSLDENGTHHHHHEERYLKCSSGFIRPKNDDVRKSMRKTIT